MKDKAPPRFRAVIRKCFDQFYQGHGGGSVRIFWRGCTLKIEIPACERKFTKAERLAARSPMAQAILQSLQNIKPGDTVAGPELAKLSGYEYDGGAFRTTLSRLVKAGRITKRRDGYARA